MAKGSMSKPPPVPVEEDGSRLSKELTPFIQQPPPYKPKSLSSSTTTEVDKGSSGSGGRCRAVKQTPSLFHQLSLSQHFTHVTIDPISSSSSSETMVGVVQPTGPDNANLSSEAHTPRCKPQQSISQQQQQQQQLDEMQHFPPSPPSHSPANASKVQVRNKRV